MKISSRHKVWKPRRCWLVLLNYLPLLHILLNCCVLFLWQNPLTPGLWFRTLIIWICKIYCYPYFFIIFRLYFLSFYIFLNIISTHTHTSLENEKLFIFVNILWLFLNSKHLLGKPRHTFLFIISEYSTIPFISPFVE